MSDPASGGRGSAGESRDALQDPAREDVVQRQRLQAAEHPDRPAQIARACCPAAKEYQPQRET